MVLPDACQPMLVRMVTFNIVDLLQSFPDKSSFVYYLFQCHT
jgi:hypothetical protein